IRCRLPLDRNPLTSLNPLRGSARDRLGTDGEIAVHYSQALQPGLLEGGLAAQVADKVPRARVHAKGPTPPRDHCGRGGVALDFGWRSRRGRGEQLPGDVRVLEADALLRPVGREGRLVVGRQRQPVECPGEYGQSFAAPRRIGHEHRIDATEGGTDEGTLLECELAGWA